jgi:ADP-ribose diphosphatase
MPTKTDGDDRQVLAEGRFLRLVRTGGWEYVERTRLSGIVVVVALTPAGRLVLVEQFRPPVGANVIELPAGLAGDEDAHRDEDLAGAARRELLEETGYEAEAFRVLAEGPPSAGLTSEVVTFVRATGLRRIGPGGGDANEDIRVHEVQLPAVESWLAERTRAGLLVDPKVYAGLYFLGVGPGEPSLST